MSTVERISARSVATRVLYRVLAKQAFASAALDAELQRARLSTRDAAFATELVYGTLRVRLALEAKLAEWVRSGLSKVEPYTQAALYVAAYQLLCLERVPSHAAVHEAVSLVGSERGKRLGAFVNAVLRRMSEERTKWAMEAALYAPLWLKKALEDSLGAERAEAFFTPRRTTPSLDLRLVDGSEITLPEAIRSRVMASIQAERPEAELSGIPWFQAVLRTRRLGDPRTLESYREGRFAVQELGSALVGALVGARGGERVLDACAGRGGKTVQLLEAVTRGGATGGKVTAVDLYEAKLGRMSAEVGRLQLSESWLETRAIDWTVGAGGLEASFDRVLVDAPCTGAGTLHRRPELLLRLEEGDPSRMGELQWSILARAAELVRPGGMVVYSVCSPLREEGIEVVRRLSSSTWEPIRAPDLCGPVQADPDGLVRLGPWLPEGGTDAYQVAFFRRKGA